MDNTTIRSKTYQFFKQYRKQFLIVFLVFTLFSAILTVVQRLLTMWVHGIAFSMEGFLQLDEVLQVVGLDIDPKTIAITLIINILSTFLSGIFSIAVLRGSDKGEFHWRDTFNITGISMINLIGIISMIELIVTALTIVLIIPGLIATYSLSMALYIYSDNPDLQIMDVLKSSYQKMRGKRWRLFTIEVYYIAWVIASYLIYVLLTVLSVHLSIVGLIFYVVVSAIISLFVLIMYVIFYREMVR